MKLGIFGGTFNPIHYGHLINAEIIRSDFDLDRIILVPAKYPVHKKLDGDVPPDHRYAMTALAVSSTREFEVSRIEIDREGPSYTITTVDDIQALHTGSELYLIIGSDAVHEFATWREPDRMLKHASLIVMRRPGGNNRPGPVFGSNNIYYAENPLIEISSSCIRDRLRAGKTIKYLLPDAVIDYIQKKGLYSN
ncbi:MAG: nicotinate (nicotinamide) nucleotide adenylyltransferase [Spirochaetes bacterium RBG_13_51_14]|nr:MAG: nicotinate (nicotinamide) nucleotide adenylyltransferase [Spirochaetes bacterium RBG_13_51_14]